MLHLHPLIWILLILFIILVFVLKGMALWKSGRNNQIIWFIFLFIFNTAGILPLIYLLFFQKREKVKKKIRKKR